MNNDVVQIKYMNHIDEIIIKKKLFYKLVSHNNIFLILSQFLFTVDTL